MASQNQTPDQGADQDPPVIESLPPRRPRANVRLDQYDRRRETIGRDEFLQLRLPLDGLLSVDEIEEVLDAARESNPGYEGEHQARQAPLGRAFTVRDPQPSRTSIRRQPRTRYRASPLGKDREDDEQKKEKAKVKVRRSKLSWKYFGFKLFGNKDKKDDGEGKGPRDIVSAPVSVRREEKN